MVLQELFTAWLVFYKCFLRWGFNLGFLKLLVDLLIIFGSMEY